MCDPRPPQEPVRVTKRCSDGGNVEKVSEILDNSNGRKSISKISSITGISKTTTRRIMKEDLKKFLYKPTVSQNISDVQREK